MSKRPLLTVVPSGIRKLSQREKFIAESVKVFPLNGTENQEDLRRIESMRAKWVEAKLALSGKQPRVRIGTEEPVRFVRQISTAMPKPWTEALPPLLRRLFR